MVFLIGLSGIFDIVFAAKVLIPRILTWDNKCDWLFRMPIIPIFTSHLPHNNENKHSISNSGYCHKSKHMELIAIVKKLKFFKKQPKKKCIKRNPSNSQ